MSHIQSRINTLGIVLPKPSLPVASYIPYTIVEKLVYISGQLPIEDGVVKYTGRLGVEIDVTEGQAAARLCALNLISHLNSATGNNLDRIERCIKIGGFISSGPEFFDQPKVLNGASDLIVEIFGESGRHTRFAVGVSNLPRQASVEIEAIFCLKV